MKKKSERPLLHEPAMARVKNGKCSIWVDLIQGLAEQARESNAGNASVKFSFVNDEETIDAEFVPEITVTVRAAEEGAS